MRFVVFGAGAIGGVIGGRLFEHGHEVVLIARGAHGDAIRERGLLLESPDRAVTIPIPVHQGPAELEFRADDIVVLAMKSQDTLPALTALSTLAPPVTPVVCAQNAIENERAALRMFANVYGMCVMCPASHLEPGSVLAHSTPTTGILDLGRWPGGVDPLAERVAAALRAATFSSEAREDIARWKYTKLLANLNNAIEAICGPLHRGGALSERVREEGMACLTAAGIDFASEQEDAARRSDLLQLRPIGGRRRGGGSSWQSLARTAGTIEVDYLNGEIVLLGRLLGVSTPVNAVLQRLATRMARDRVAPGTFSEDDVLAEAASLPD